jgi:hypothetical protein
MLLLPPFIPDWPPWNAFFNVAFEGWAVHIPSSYTLTAPFLLILVTYQRQHWLTTSTHIEFITSTILAPAHPFNWSHNIMGFGFLIGGGYKWKCHDCGTKNPITSQYCTNRRCRQFYRVHLARCGSKRGGDVDLLGVRAWLVMKITCWILFAIFCDL